MQVNDIIGFIGVLLILIGFFLNILNIIKKEDFSYILLNLSGATIACLASVLINYLPFVILEGIWALVSFYALINKLKGIDG